MHFWPPCVHPDIVLSSPPHQYTSDSPSLRPSRSLDNALSRMPQALAVEQPVHDPVLQVLRKYPAGVVRAFIFTLTAEHGWQATLHTYTCMHIGKLAVMSCCPTVLCRYSESDSLRCTAAIVPLSMLHCIFCLPTAPAAWL